VISDWWPCSLVSFVSVIESWHTGLGVFLKETSFHGVMLDDVISGAPEVLTVLQDIVTQGISAGVVQPLPRTVFPDTEVEHAFRYSCNGANLWEVEVQGVNAETDFTFSSLPRTVGVVQHWFGTEFPNVENTLRGNCLLDLLIWKMWQTVVIIVAYSPCFFLLLCGYLTVNPVCLSCVFWNLFLFHFNLCSFFLVSDIFLNLFPFWYCSSFNFHLRTFYMIPYSSIFKCASVVSYVVCECIF
jgi:hypothetical protein